MTDLQPGGEDGVAKLVDAYRLEVLRREQLEAELQSCKQLFMQTQRKDAEQRQETERELRGSEEKFRQLAENIREVFWIREVASDALIYVSPGFETIWGIPLDEDVSQRWCDSLHADDRGRVLSSLERRQLEGKFDEVYRIIRPDGSTRWIRDRAFPVRDGGEVRRIVGIAEDITAVREAEERLRQAQKMEAIGRLAGGVAHDFNNLLSVIFGYSGFMQEDLAPDDPLRENVEEIVKATRRASDLTQQLLIFSRRQTQTLQPLNLNELVTNTERMIRRVLGEDIELVFRPGASLGCVRADVSNLEQVLVNLVVNARDAMPTGGRLTVETANVELGKDHPLTHVAERQGPHVMLSVSDTGIGMDQATQSRIFEPFFTTKRLGKGTGLGLSIVFGIVEQHGGSIWVYSEPGHGTTFKVYLPRSELPAASARPGAARAPGGHETILLVEDEAQVRAIAQTILRRCGYRVLVAQSAAEALCLCQGHEPIDLLLTDLVMPQMSGAELARRLAVERPAMKMLCMSGYTDDAILRHGLVDSALAFLQKPFTSETLSTKVREVLGAPSSPGGDLARRAG